MVRARSLSLSVRLAFASLGTALAIGTVCAVGLFSLENVWRRASAWVAGHLELLDDTAAFGALVYQKGFAAEYMLTSDRRWLAELASSRAPFERWLQQARATAASADERQLVDEIQSEYSAYTEGRSRALAMFDGGDPPGATRALSENQVHLERLLVLFRSAGQAGRRALAAQFNGAEWSVKRLGRLLVGTSIAGALASLLVGFWWARRITRPIYELRVMVDSAAERTRIQVRPGRSDDLDRLGEQVSALVRKLEDTDAALVDHRRRLIQSEKLSAVGEIAAKLAHEVLNPLAGMKAAVQLLVRGGRPVSPGELGETAEALNREITRVESLLRRLTNFARPLAPRIEVCGVARLLDDAVAAAQPTYARLGVTLRRLRDGEGALPPLEVDPLLLTQALGNLLVNAAEASPPGGAVTIGAASEQSLGKPAVAVSVADGGSGIAAANLPRLFQPFFTTKPSGHGLGLAVSQNILAEHGGHITAANRPPAEGPGAVFTLHIPIVR
ncbi:MAG TPA: ATP-binding protein [Polyangia bacterium]|nr:ATP-binding protein [Polyangia bacterium]